MNRDDFIDRACIELMPLAVQMSAQAEPTLAGARPRMQIDIAGAASNAVKAAEALWEARQRLGRTSTAKLD